MGYNCHITRKQDWADDEGPVISLREWSRYVASDAEIIQETDNCPEDFLYINHPQEPWPLWWGHGGEIYTKNPDEIVIGKLIQIAKQLDATVMGDDGEIYTEADINHASADQAETVEIKIGWLQRLFRV